ncbi:hypothetical protein HBA55_19035 [Pseudomaricurvus alkylphenolicus]|uniref:Zn-ribbon domain-containing OB-fold protein n=1 Tax=Pseudomaricurvus alkylphenolicus TaxID=1306991 RepID=UPI0014226D1B|nr:OB-fold domain-containing protein [Pseudomaricurvus alkylphenolicus]NIB41708.1 hypothetical protein [Pseudomaricurvus alkylphenolicus]
MSEYKKPIPKVNEMTKGHWDGCKNHELRIQRCSCCETYCHPPQPMCAKCNSTAMEWHPVEGKGTVYSYIICRNTSVGEFPARGFTYPYATVMIELDGVEGVRIASNLVDCELEDIKIGMPVSVVFEKINDDITLPKFRPL